jgi:3'-phosphoadenosine 5'-phosphosulfate sulfotransferase (PAPS reductase)/FAD synthetase
MIGYTLPSGKIQISFSGGRTSAYMLHQILAVNGGLDPKRVQVVFSNTGREMPETLDFVQECGDRWGVEIVWVEDAKRVRGQPIFDVVSHNSASRDGTPFSDLIFRKSALPNQAQRFCTEHLKILPARRYLMSLGWKHWSNALGMRSDEAHRKKPSPDKRVTRWFPLEDVDKKMVNAFWSKMPFDLKVEPGFGNCDGCFLKSESSLAALTRRHPDRAAWWQKQEQDRGNLFRNNYPRSELTSMVERQGDWIFDTEGYLCQADDGECNG